MTSGVVVVLVTDLVDSTVTLTRLGEDQNERLRRIHFDLLRAALDANGGEEVKSLGDGIMAVFGSANAAIAAAVDIQRSAHRHNLRADPAPLKIRIGLHAGEAIRADGDWFGEPVVVASRLCAKAIGGQIVTSDLVKLLLGRRQDVRFDALGELELKGIEDPVAASLVEWSNDEPAWPVPNLLARPATPWVGRSVEHDRLTTVWKRVAEGGERRVVFIAGEPGVGKTRLTIEVANDAAASGAIVVCGRCDEETSIPYEPFIEIVRQLLAACGQDELDARLAEDGATLARLVPELRRASGPLGGIVAEAEVERLVLFEAIGALLATVSAAAPVVLVLDDLHWAAKPTLLLLRHLVQDFKSRGPVLIIGTYRDTDLDRSHPLAALLADFRRSPDVERVALKGLDAPAVAAYVESAAGQSLDERGEELACAIHAETEGNPFFVGEILRHLVESGLLFQRDGQWTSDLSVDELGIPEGVREVIGRRLSRLSATANQALAIAALIGREFDADLVEVVAELDGDVVLDALEEAASAGIVGEVERAPGRFSFAHALVQDTLATELTSARASRLHRRIGEAIEGRYATTLDRWLPALARHYAEAARAGQVEKAATFGIRAARQALERVAYEDAIALAERVLQVLDLEDDPDPALRFEAHLASIDAQRHIGPLRWEVVMELVTSARAVGTPEALGEAVAFGRNAGGFEEKHALVAATREAVERLTDPSPVRARALSSLAFLLSLASDPDADTVTSRAMDEAMAVGDVSALVGVAMLAGFQNGSIDVGRLESSIGMLERFGPVPHPTVQLSRHYLAAMLDLVRGDRSGLERTADAFLELAKDRRHGTPLLQAYHFKALLALLDGRWDDVSRNVAQAGNWPSATGELLNAGPLLISALERGQYDGLEELLASLRVDHPDLPVLPAAIARLRAEQGDLDAAREVIAPIIRDGIPRLPNDLLWAATAGFLAEVAAHMNDAAMGALLEPLLRRAQGLAVSAGYVFCLGAGDRFLAMLASVAGRHDEAQALFTAALTFDRDRLRSPVLAARTLYWSAVDAQRRGETAVSRSLAGEARDEATATGAFAISRLAQRLIDELS